MRRLLAYTAALSVAGPAFAQISEAWEDQIDLIWDCTFAQPTGQSQVWLTINGQDGSAYRFGGATLGIGGADYELDGTLWPDRAEFQDDFGDYGPPKTTLLTIARADGAAEFYPPDGTQSVTGTCEIRI